VAQVLRLFIAFELTPSTRNAVEHALKTIRAKVPAQVVRWTPLGNVHLTLKFLGDVPTSQVESITQALHETAQGFAPLPIEVAEAGCFPNPKRPRIVWLGLKEATGKMIQLQAQVEQSIAPLGYPAEARPFTPHLTIGRVKKDVPFAELAKLGSTIQNLHLGTLSTWECAKISLMQSELRPEGAQYTTVKAIGLKYD
jgi:2'-5' RNA ligase